MSVPEAHQWQCAVLTSSAVLWTWSCLQVEALEGILWGNAPSQPLYQMSKQEERTSRQFLSTHIYVHLFSGHHAQGLYKQKPLVRKCQSCPLLILPSQNRSTSHSCEDNTVISVQCFSTYKVHINHPGIWLECTFRFHRSGVDPKLLHL